MPQSISISSENSALECPAGAQARVRVKVTNLGEAVGQYELSVGGIDPSWARFEPNQLSAFPGDSAQAWLVLSPPVGTLGAIYPVTVVAASLGGPAAQARSTLNLTVRSTGQAPRQVAAPPPASMPSGRVPPPPAIPPTPPPSSPASSSGTVRVSSPGSGQLELVVDRDSAQLPPGARRTFNLVLRNAGGAGLAVDLFTRGVPRNWLTLSSASASLSPGQTVRATLEVSRPPQVPAGHYPLSLVVQARDDPAVMVSVDLKVELVESGSASAAPSGKQTELGSLPEVARQPVQPVRATAASKGIPRAVIVTPASQSDAGLAGGRLALWIIGGAVVVLLVLITACGLVLYLFYLPRLTPAQIPTFLAPTRAQVEFKSTAAAPTALPLSTLTPRMPDTTAPSPTATVRPPDTAIPLPTWTARPVPTPTIAQVVAPGLYVATLRTEPPSPGERQEVGFYVTFLNTTAATQQYRWNVYVYKADNQKNPFGEASAQLTTIPIGTTEHKALGYWKAGVGTCGNYIARVAWLDESKNATPFTRSDGRVFELPFTVCQ